MIWTLSTILGAVCGFLAVGGALAWGIKRGSIGL